jgi:hypothetical protein
MQRMPQNVFDSLVIVRAMSDLAKDDNIVREAIKEYVSIYPGENAQELEKDINEAVIIAWDATSLMLKLRPPKSNEDDPKIYLCGAQFFEQGNQGDRYFR